MTITYTRPKLKAPDAVVSDGKFNYGTYNQAIKKVNLLDAVKPLGNKPSNLWKNFRLKEWQALQIGNKDYFIMVAIYNAKVLSIAQFIVFDIKNSKKYKYELKVPFWKIHVANGLYKTESYYEDKNYKLRAENNLEQGTIKLHVDIKNFNKELPDLQGEFTGYHQQGKVEPQVVVMPFEGNRGMYSHKCLMPLKGTLKLGDKAINFLPESSHMIIDDHKGYYPREMEWDWVTGATYLQDGRLIGFNFTDNQVKDQETYNENCLWVNENLYPMPPIKIERPEGIDIGKKWFIKDEYGSVNLEFTPTVNTRVDINALVIRSDYHGPYGFFNGTIETPDGEIIKIDNIFGMGEKFYLKA